MAPYPRIKKGNIYVLTIVNVCSKYVIIRATKNTKASSTKKIMEVFAVFGTPSILNSDRGTCFTAKDVKDFIEKHNITKVKNASMTWIMKI